LASPVAQASGRSAGRPGAAAVPTIPPRIRTAAGPGSGERSGRGWPLPAGHSPNKGALRPLRAPGPAPPRTGRPDPPDANPIRDNPSSHPAGTYNPLRPRPAPFCCLENNNSAGSAVRLSPLSWEKNLFFPHRLAFQFQLMAAVDQAIQDRIYQRGIMDEGMEMGAAC